MAWLLLRVAGALAIIFGYAALVIRTNSMESAPRAVVLPTPATPRGSQPVGSIDWPADGSLVSQPIEIRGWAIDGASESGSGVDQVSVYCDGTLLAAADLGQLRSDIASQFGFRFARAGWRAQADLSTRPAGTHQLEARARSSVSGEETSYSRAIVLEAPPSTPRGAVDAPDERAPVFGTIEARGWAIDAAASDGTGIDTVQVYLDNQPIGRAAYGGMRDDVGAQFGPRFQASAWAAAIDLTPVATGEHTLEARAHSAYDGHETSYTRTIVVARAPGVPRGYIDQPAEGTAVAGRVLIQGWAIDAAALDGGSGVNRVDLYVDGNLVAAATYGRARDDVGSGYGKSFVASGWEGRVDLSGLAPGAHTLEARAHSTYSGEETAYRRAVIVTGR